MNDHYFSAQPSSAARRQEITVSLAGRQVPVTTAAGTFSPGHLDTGTEVLLRRLPAPPETGHLLDLGCGWGPLTLHAALTGGPGLTVWALDINERALELTRENASRHGLTQVRPVTAEQVPEQLRFHQIWSNPPIKVGKPALHALLRSWLPRLEPGGTAWLVVAKQLGADSLLRWLDSGAWLDADDGTSTQTVPFRATRHSSAKGFRVLTVERLP